MTAPDAADAPVAAGRLIALVLALPVAVWAADDPSLWGDGLNVPAVLALVAALTAPPVLAIGAAALWLRCRGRSQTLRVVLRIVLLVSQAGWAAFSAVIIFAYSEFGGVTVGWGLIAMSFTVALGLLALAWWTEDRLAARSGRARWRRFPAAGTGT